MPLVSTKADARRSYEWEVEFKLPALQSAALDTFNLAAKKVSGSGFKVDKIQVDRVNDKTFYAGKATPDELTVVFDNLKNDDVLAKLYETMKSSYDPNTGVFSGVDEYKGLLNVIQLNEIRDPVGESRYVGAFMTSWKPSDFDYAQNEFHTITCTFSYDFVVQKSIV